MGFVSAFIRLTRFEHAIMLAIAVLIGETIVLGALPPATLLIILSLLIPIFSEMGSFALNDYLDVESDKLNKRNDRPIVSGEISPKFAYYFSIASLLLSVIFAYYCNVYAFIIALVFNIFAVLYNYKLKDLPLVGNIYIGLTMAIPFIFGSAIITNSFDFSPTIIVLFCMAFIAGVAREIIKSVQDMEGDKKARKSQTLPLVIGARKSILIACVLYLLFLPLTALPFIYGLKQNAIAMGLIVAADLGILYIIYLLLKKTENPKTFKIARDMSLACLFMGLVAYLIAAIG